MPASDRLMIGIAGPTCSGKSTLERNLEIALGENISTLPFDGMTMELDDPGEIGADSWERPECYRWEDYRRHLKELRLGQATIVHVNRWEAEITGMHERLIEPRPIIVSVGFLALHDDFVRKQFDLKLYLDIPEEVIINRRARVERMLAPAVNPLPYIMNHVIPGTREFVVPQRRHADEVIDGLQPPDSLLDEVLAEIRARRISR